MLSILSSVAQSLAEIAWWIRALLGMGLGAALAVGAPAVLAWWLDRFHPIEITVSCLMVTMPRTMPSSGMRTIVVYPGGGGTQVSLSEAGSATGWPENQIGYRCEVRNLSRGELPSLSITLPVHYEYLKAGDAKPRRSAETITILAPYLDARADAPFEFYVTHFGSFRARVDAIEVKYYGSSSGRALKLKSNLLLYPIVFDVQELRPLEG